MNRTILTSTGTMVSRLNGYDYKRALREAAGICADGLSSGIDILNEAAQYPDGVELSMLK